jgi:hypothetical protein
MLGLELKQFGQGTQEAITGLWLCCLEVVKLSQAGSLIA